jgi:hypothetical protein
MVMSNQSPRQIRARGLRTRIVTSTGIDPTDQGQAIMRLKTLVIAQVAEEIFDPNDHDSLISNRIARHHKMLMLNEDRFIPNSSEMKDAQPQFHPTNSITNRVSRRSTKETVNGAPITDRQIGTAVIEII